MSLFISLSFFSVGLFLILKGADFFVSGASSLARHVRVSALFIGLTIVAFGTSAPELVVSMSASIMGNNDIAISNVLGSNIANILLILGFSAFILPLHVRRSTTWKEIPFAFLALVAMMVMVKSASIDQYLPDSVITQGVFEGISRSEGIMLLLFFIIFMYYLVSIARDTHDESREIPRYPLPRSSLMLAVGLAMLVLGGNWMVKGASEIARFFQVSESFIGLTIVALGTSLPELATSVTAAFKKEMDIAVGNVVGSNIFNILFVLSLSSLVAPLSFSTGLLDDAWISLVATFLLFVVMFVGKRHTLERWQGGVFLIGYGIYLAYLFIQR